MKEYGGFLELEKNTGREYHDGAVALNLARNCLRYLIKARNIKRIWLPRFLCKSVIVACKAEGITIEYYSIDETLRPVFGVFDLLSEGDYFYLVNYYGFLSNEEIKYYASREPHIIVDNTQAFFAEPLSGVDTIYTCRKYFGTPDGAYLYTDAELVDELPEDRSWDRMTHILGRYEGNASDFYGKYRDNEDALINIPVMRMSSITHNLMRGIDYERAREYRVGNYAYLQEAFWGINQLAASSCTQIGPFMYPMLVEHGAQLRKKLQAQKIYVPTLWSDVFEICRPDELEYKLAENILPLPVDQRYGLEDMRYIEESVKACIAGEN